MDEFDVVVVGAGPSGGQCARKLSQQGVKVLLIEQHQNFAANNFSSAASILNIISDFNLPTSIIGSYWHNLEIYSTNIKRKWNSASPKGVVLNFAKLRQYLANEVIKNGGQVWMECRYLSHYQSQNFYIIQVKKNGYKDQIKSRVIVDATGFKRAVINGKSQHNSSFIKLVGSEFLIEVDSDIHAQYNQTLHFFLGHYWCPKGYSWIFPMDNNQLNVGAVIYKSPHQLSIAEKPIQASIYLLLNEFLALKNSNILDIHGLIALYTPGLNDCYFQNQIIGLGDTISTLNLLGGEGIRHSMTSANIASDYIHDYLTDKKADFTDYEHHLKNLFQTDWDLSEKLAKKVYLESSDRKINLGVRALSLINFEQLLDILFYYKFEQYKKPWLENIVKIIKKIFTKYWALLKVRY